VTFGAQPAGSFISQPLQKTFDSWWTMSLTNFKANGKRHSSMAKLAIADTGTSLLCMIQSDYNKF
jgi:hypothetical protein